MRLFELKEKFIQKNIPDEFIGIYYLGKIIDNKFKIKYIGRSDVMLKRRLVQHSRIGKYDYFNFKNTKTIKEAFFLECREWHGIDHLDNKIHPASPNYLPYSCPYCMAIYEFGKINY